MYGLLVRVVCIRITMPEYEDVDVVLNEIGGFSFDEIGGVVERMVESNNTKSFVITPQPVVGDEPKYRMRIEDQNP